MNADDTTLGEHPKHWRVFPCCIHDYVCDWCQHSMVSINIGWVVDIDLNGRFSGDADLWTCSALCPNDMVMYASTLCLDDMVKCVEKKYKSCT